MSGLLDLKNSLSPEDQEKLTQINGFVRQGMEILYGDEANFENMVSVFKAGNQESLSKDMSKVVNGILDRIEKENGDLPDEILASVGLLIMNNIAVDLEKGGMAKITPENADQMKQQASQDWMTNHSDRVDQSSAQQAAQQYGG